MRNQLFSNKLKVCKECGLGYNDDRKSFSDSDGFQIHKHERMCPKCSRRFK